MRSAPCWLVFCIWQYVWYEVRIDNPIIRKELQDLFPNSIQFVGILPKPLTTHSYPIALSSDNYRSRFHHEDCYDDHRCRRRRGTHFIQQSKQHENFITLFNNSKKQDDLADCLLQALSFEKNDIFLSLSSQKLDTVCKISSRKPTPNQYKKGLTKSNLKWLFICQSFSSLENYENFIQQNPAISKAIKKWYNNDISQTLREFDINLDSTINI